jgi:hypothetical protein
MMQLFTHFLLSIPLLTQKFTSAVTRLTFTRKIYDSNVGPSVVVVVVVVVAAAAAAVVVVVVVVVVISVSVLVVVEVVIFEQYTRNLDAQCINENGFCEKFRVS